MSAGHGGIFIVGFLISFIGSLFIVETRLFVSGGIGCVRILLFVPTDLVPPAPFLQCDPDLTHGGSGVLADPARIDEEFRKAWLPFFCRSGQREASLERNSLLKWRGGCLCFLWYLCLS